MPPSAQATRRPAAARTTRVASTSKPTTITKASTSKLKTTATTKPITKSTTTTTPDELADQLAANLTITNGKGKQKAPPSVEEKRLTAMRAVNAASQTLSATVKSGWKASSEPSTVKGKKPSVTMSTAISSAAAVGKSLEELRLMSPGDVDVERAASSAVGKLIALEMVCQ